MLNFIFLVPLAACDTIFFITIFHTMLKSIGRVPIFIVLTHARVCQRKHASHWFACSSGVSAASQLQTNQWRARRDAEILNWSKNKLRLHYPYVYAWWWKVNDAIAFDWNPHRALAACTPISQHVSLLRLHAVLQLVINILFHINERFSSSSYHVSCRRRRKYLCTSKVESSERHVPRIDSFQSAFPAEQKIITNNNSGVEWRRDSGAVETYYLLN